jgi:hypothetical protein
MPVKSLDYAPRWFPVDSSFISRLGWLENIRAGGTVFVEIVDEKTRRVLGQYAFHDVPRFVWHAFRDAGSKGTYFNAVLKKRFVPIKIG